ncbi:hypothetical protein, partial [Citrobacter braakii]|uniref:hypothetical protein n=1 Tax=Citrobacter braakii TaxID=57706 RepID=UPI0019818C6C
EQRDPAEREALRILRLASPRGAQILTTVADQLHDNELIAAFLAEDGGEIGRSVWMRTHSDDATNAPAPPPRPAGGLALLPKSPATSRCAVCER